jgi:hypothetical protein
MPMGSPEVSSTLPSVSFKPIGIWLRSICCRLPSRTPLLKSKLWVNWRYTTVFCQPGSPLYKQDLLFLHNITVKMLEQLRSTTHQSVYLGTVPVNCVFQAFNGCLAALGAFMRDITNSSLSFVNSSQELWPLWTSNPKKSLWARIRPFTIRSYLSSLSFIDSIVKLPLPFSSRSRLIQLHLEISSRPVLLLSSCSARTLAIRFRAPTKVVLHRLQQGPLSPSVPTLLFV